MDSFAHILKETISVSILVFTMMLWVDFVNVMSAGHFADFVSSGKKRQYLISSSFGAVPGCLGAFMNVSFYMHGLLSFGAVLAGMLATSGDEAFVMFSLFPQEALVLTAILFLVGILVGYIADRIPALQGIASHGCADSMIHKEDRKISLDLNDLMANIKTFSYTRLLIVAVLVFAFFAYVFGIFSTEGSLLQKILFSFFTASSALIVLLSPKHYVKEHIWLHIIKKHLTKVTLMTFAAFIAVELLLLYSDLNAIFVDENMSWILILACVIGLIPQSGPHLVFVMFFFHGLVPFSVLLASSIVQDGHALLPLMSFSLKDAFYIKAIKFALALIIGGILLALGF